MHTQPAHQAQDVLCRYAVGYNSVHSVMPASRATRRATRSPAVCTNFTITRRCLLPPDSSLTMLLLLQQLPVDLEHRRLLVLLLAELPPQQQPQLEQLSEKDATSLPAVLATQLPAALPESRLLPLALPATAAVYSRRNCSTGADCAVRIG